ncbi:MAG TPA: tRNA pseudouridine(55) synthase TruB [Noviherbaspirillum sp.]|uniref:tRNA pseudouridine(55) synthase TruB n=1 Tax=Noviherbaspirillum sp. TaxID=1926288 RepID=UPI002DDD05AD|nr:tRNA pseudouridine(55) synthase TruB [Noviherbaspirillum sp.]HEV2610892.1 tRNA pseudouridine(55) synthase TruB [Noviherbaspirillum sp.]
MTLSTKKIRLPLHGVLLLDKSAGHSSNDVLIKAKRLLNAQKAGHTGTLDPFATGLLPLCFGEATKFAQDLLDASKTYDAVIHLGIVTSTGDTEGERLRVCDVNVTAAKIDAALAQFRGDIRQVPPMYSALKREGRPLYEYARAGITLEREARAVTIHSLECIDYKAPYLTIRVSCSKGTYIRVLGEDIGEVLGCGGHLKALRRTGVGALRVEGANTLESIEATSQEQRAGLLAPVDTLLSTFSPLSLTDELARRFLHGQRLALGKENVHLPNQRERMRVYRASDGKLLGTAQLMEFGVLAPERLIVA